MSAENDAWGGRARRLMDAFPAAVLLVDKDVRVLLMNRAAKAYLATPEATLENLLCGDVLQCVHPRECDAGCGDTEFCAQCTVRQAVRAAVAGEEVLRWWGEMRLLREGKEQVLSLLVSVSAVEGEDPPLFLLVLEDVSEIAQLRRLLPICANCGKVRSGEHYWQGVAEYLQEHTSVEFSHGLCPECLVDLYGEKWT
jgi:PAS domain-containing protein